MQDVVDLGAVSDGNDAFLQLLGSRKIVPKLLHFAHCPPASSELHQIFVNASHLRHTEYHQV